MAIFQCKIMYIQRLVFSGCEWAAKEECTRDPESRAAMLRAFCLENSAKQSLCHWDGGPKPILTWLREESSNI